MLIWSPKGNARVRYIAKVFARRYTKNAFKFTTDAEVFQEYQGLKLAYGINLPNVLCLPQHPRMQEQSYKAWRPKAADATGFACSPVDKWNYDPFALAFFYLSRYEEYADFSADAHGRFPAQMALGAQLNFSPIVDQTFKAIAQSLNQYFPRWRPPVQQRTFQASFDIDYAFAFRYKAYWRWWGAATRSLLHRDWGRLQAQLSTAIGQADPYDYFEQILEKGKRAKNPPRIFWLLADWATFDKNNQVSAKGFQQLIRQVAEVLPVGLHPSYRAATDIERLKLEKQRLESILNRPVRHSRQHFLRLRFPDTYRQLLSVGIEADYSMGFAEVLGYRAGTAHPFDWFDLEKDEATKLRIYPFSFMDVSLQNYLQLSAAEGLNRALPYREAQAAAMGVFHNNSFCNRWEWEGWKPALERLAWGEADQNA